VQATGTHTRVDVDTGHNIFCAGFAHLPNGLLFLAAGNRDEQLNGIVQTHVFNPVNNSWTLGANMAAGRWYPSVTPQCPRERAHRGPRRVHALHRRRRRRPVGGEDGDGRIRGTISTPTATPSNQPPTVSLTSPANSANFTSPAKISLAATASDPDGSVARVEFLNGGTKLGEDTTVPYTLRWNVAAAGTYTLTARAADNAGATTTSGPATITVSKKPR
jgi:hypothetical protein